MKTPKLKILLILLFCCSLSLAQDYNITNYTVSDGLPSGKILRVFQDSRGFLWLSTDAGISRFDGVHFLNYSVSDGLNFNLTKAFAEDPSGHIWITTGRGICRFDGIYFHQIDSISGRSIHNARDLLITRQGEIFISTKYGVAHISGEKEYFYTEANGLIHNNCFNLIQTKKGKILLAGENGINEYSGNNTWKPFCKEPGQKVITLAEDRDGVVWYTLLHKKVKKCSAGISASLEMPGQDTIGFTVGLTIDNNNRLIVAHGNHLQVYDKGVFIKNIGNMLKIPSDAINSVFVDRENNYWFTSLYGLWKIHAGYIRSFPTDGVKGKSIYTLAGIGKDSVMFSDGHLIYCVSNTGIRQILSDKPQQWGETHSIVQDGKGYWYFSHALGGIVCYDPFSKTYKNLTAPFGSFVHALCGANGPDGEVMIGGSGCLYRCYEGNIERIVPDSQMSTENVLALLYDRKGGLWIGLSSGFYYLKDGVFSDHSYIFKDKEIIISEIQETESGELLLSTKGAGLIRVLHENKRIWIKEKYDVNSGMPSDFITSAIEDKFGNIWVSSFSGLVLIQKGKAKNYIELLGKGRGVPDAFWNYCNFTKDPDGCLWIGSSNALLKINPEKLPRKKEAIQAHITRILMDGNPVTDSSVERSGIFSYGNISQFDYDQNSFTFEYTGINLTNPESQNYVYRLVGLGKEAWSKPITDRKVTLNNLEPGNYTFYVKEATAPNRLAASYSFTILKPFWQTAWFRIAAILFILTSLAAYLRYRINTNNKKQSEKLEINRQLSESRYLAFQARMNPHFIFNSLNSIQYFITQNDKAPTLNYLSKFARLLRQILDNSKELKVSLKDEIDLLQNYIEMESMRFENRFQFELEVEEHLDINNTEIPGMLIQPFVENSIMHGLLHKSNGDGKLHISMTKQDKYVVCTVSDNGIGREASALINSSRKPNHKSYGTEIAMNRMRLLNDLEDGLIEIVDLKTEAGTAAGTKVIIKLPHT